MAPKSIPPPWKQLNPLIDAEALLVGMKMYPAMDEHKFAWSDAADAMDLLAKAIEGQADKVPPVQSVALGLDTTQPTDSMNKDLTADDHGGKVVAKQPKTVSTIRKHLGQPGWQIAVRITVSHQGQDFVMFVPTYKGDTQSLLKDLPDAALFGAEIDHEQKIIYLYP